MYHFYLLNSWDLNWNNIGTHCIIFPNLKVYFEIKIHYISRNHCNANYKSFWLYGIACKENEVLGCFYQKKSTFHEIELFLILHPV